MESENLVFTDKQKAIDFALWSNFMVSLKSDRPKPQDSFALVQSSPGEYRLKPLTYPYQKDENRVDLPKDYADMTYDHIRGICSDESPIPHFEELAGLFSNVDGALLRFILEKKIPLEKLIRFELASRGHDLRMKWCSFKKAEEIWLE